MGYVRVVFCKLLLQRWAVRFNSTAVTMLDVKKKQNTTDSQMRTQRYNLAVMKRKSSEYIQALQWERCVGSKTNQTHEYNVWCVDYLTVLTADQTI